jgi:hypothetical protein
MRSILIRFAVPTLIAVSILAFFGVPYVDRILAEWFRRDVDLRAQLVAHSIEGSLTGFLERGDEKGLANYLGAITTDERLMAIVLCDDGDKALFKTDRTPTQIECSARHDLGERGSSIARLADGSVEVSSFPMGNANGKSVTALIVHDLSFIDRRQSSARNYVLALAGVAASVLALFLGFVFWLLIRRWVNELLADIRGRRFLDDARSEPGSRPLLTQIRRVLREVETTQRLEIDFHENWTPQALQQVVRDHLGAPEVFIVSNREPYIHNAGPSGPVVQARRRAIGCALMVLAVAIASCERTSGPAVVAETAQLICDPAQLSLTAGASGKIAVRANDAAGQRIDGASIRFTVADPRLLRATALGEVTSLGPAGPTSVSITSGSHSLTVPVDVSAGPAHRFEAVGAGPRVMIAGMPPKDRVDVRLLDAFGNPVADSPVRFEAAINPPVSISAATDANGIASATLPTITQAGPFTLNVHASSFPRVSLPLDVQVNAAAAATLEAVKVPASGPVALFAEVELVLRVRDAFGNPVPNVMVRWRTDSGSESFDPRQSLSGPDGLVRTRWLLTGLKRRSTTLRAFVLDDEKIGFKTWVALER